MAKNKRKPSASQRDKVAIATAKILKKKGVLSKTTKLHGGRYVSRSVLKKVQEFQHVASPDYKAFEVPKKFADLAKAAGYQVVRGNQLIIPNDPDWIKRLKKAVKEFLETGYTEFLGGVKPVKGGLMEEVQMPFSGMNAEEVIATLEAGLLDTLKLEGESFAFRIGDGDGSRGMSYRTFSTSRQIKEWLQYYNPDALSSGFKVYRLHPHDMRKFIRSPNERKRERAAMERKGPREKPRGYSKYRNRMEKLDKFNPDKAEKIRNASKERSRARYEKQKSDPVYMAKQREKSLSRYYANKGKRK